MAKTKKLKKKDFEKILQILEKNYRKKIVEEPKSVLSQLIFSIIARNFTRKGAEKAFALIQEKFVDWNEVRISSVSEITEVLEAVKAPNVEKKAKNIKKILVDIYNDYHKISLEFVKNLNPEKTKKILEGLIGITPRVRDSVLLFALDYPVVPVVSPLARVVRRLGFVDFDESQKKIKQKLEALFPKSKIEKYTKLLIYHGEMICTLQKPNCKKCLLAKMCPYPKLPKSQKTAAFIKNTETLDIDKLREIERERKKTKTKQTKKPKQSVKKTGSAKRATSSKKTTRKEKTIRTTKNNKPKSKKAAKPTKKKQAATTPKRAKTAVSKKRTKQTALASKTTKKSRSSGNKKRKTTSSSKTKKSAPPRKKTQSPKKTAKRSKKK